MDNCGDNYLKLWITYCMFIGEYIHTIDQKRRLAIPAKWRKALGKKAVITRGLDNCLVIYPLKEWKTMSAKLENLPSGQVNARIFTRVMLSGATDVELDKLGRILILDNLREYAFLKREVAFLGLSNRIEIWDISRWQEYREKAEKTVDEMAQQLGI